MSNLKGQGSLPVWLVLGVLCAYLFTTLPPRWLLVSAVFIGAFLLLQAATRWIAVVILACCWTLWQFELVLEDRLEVSLSGKVVEVNGRISSIPQIYPDYARFRFDPLPDDKQQDLPAHLLVYWYRDFPGLSVGENWRLTLQLKPPWGRVNFQGGDRERWLFSEKIGGLGTVRSGQFVFASPPNNYFFENTRSRVRDKISRLLDDERMRGIVQALAIADRSGMAFTDRQLLSSTGTSHLLAISGLHIGLAAVGGAWLARISMMMLPVSFMARWGFGTTLAGAFLAALAYATLAGWGVSTQRAVLMLVVAASALAFNRSVHPARAWVLALAAVLLVDPLAPLGSGSWFSFLAVAVLMMLFIPRSGRISWWKTALLAQAGVVVALLPLTVFWFQSFSPVGFLANLGAIPWVSLVVVPLTLAGVALLPVSMTVAGWFLKLAGESASVLFLYLEYLAEMQGPVPILPAPGILAVVLAMLGGMLLLFPSGIPVRWIGLFLILPLFLPPGPRTERGSLLIEALDAGQGTAVLLSTENHTLLYDSGPGDGAEQNLVHTVISPALAGLGRNAPERIIISHGDLDHAGGLATLLKYYPAAKLYARLPKQSAQIDRCYSGLAWNQDGFEFQIFHPSTALPYLGNDSSCVLSVRGQGASVLLPGDISTPIEQRLLDARLARYRVLLVPHHGSITSSSAEFISRVSPEASIATASLGNRFGFPRQEIKQRYIDAGSNFWSTGACGALKIQITSDGVLHAQSARRKRNRIWRWPAAPECP